MLESCSGSKGTRGEHEVLDRESLMEDVYTYIDEESYFPAIQILKALVEQEPNNFALRYLLAQLHQKTNNQLGAILIYEELMVERPLDARFRWELAISYLKMGFVSYALVHFTEFLNLTLNLKINESKIV